MNKQVPSTGKISSSAQEALAYATTVSENTNDTWCLHLYFSCLKYYNRRANKVKTALKNFYQADATAEIHIFFYQNQDAFIFFKPEARQFCDNVLHKLLALYGDDPLLSSGSAGERAFYSWYHTVHDHQTMMEHISNYVEQVNAVEEEYNKYMNSRYLIQQRQELGEPMNMGHLARLHNMIDQIDLSLMLRTQPIIKIEENDFEEVFRETRVRIDDLGKEMLPNIYLRSNRWLFKKLTEALDIALLRSFSHRDHIIQLGTELIGMGLNIQSLMTPEFKQFDSLLGQATGPRSMIIGLQLDDIYVHADHYAHIVDVLHEYEYTLCLEDVRHTMLDTINFQALQVQYLKLLWSDELSTMNENMLLALKTNIEAIQEHVIVILSQCTDRSAYEVGTKLGIKHYQGSAIEGVVESIQSTRLLAPKKYGISR